MLTDLFCGLFRSWPDNKFLELDNLRLKVITLLALSGLMRPSDLAPRGQVREGKNLHPIIFSREHLFFRQDGSVQMTIWGTKTDYNRDGFTVVIQPASDPKVDPVSVLRCYLDITADFAANVPGNPVLLTLKPPYRAISTPTVSDILNKAVSLVGLPKNSFSAKSFRAAGATSALQRGQQPHRVRKLGRWRTQSVIDEHYDLSVPPTDITDDVLNI